MNALPIILVAVMIPFTLLAAFWDMRTHRLPNWITVPSFVAGVLFHIIHGAIAGATWYGGAAEGLGFSMAGFAAGFLPLLLLWMIGGGGAGDVKLMGAIGAWMGLTLTMITYVLSMVFVAFVAVGLLCYRAIRPARQKNASQPKSSGAEGRRWQAPIVPFGVPVCAATWLVLMWNLAKVSG